MPSEDARRAEAPAGRVLLIPGLDGDPRLIMSVAPRLFRGLRVLPFDHLRDQGEGGAEGMADRALAIIDGDPAGEAPAYVCGESFGGTVALALARRHPARVRGLVLLSAFGWYPSAHTYAGRLGMAIWRLIGDRLVARIFRLWRPLSMPGALGLRCPPVITRAYLQWPDIDLPGHRNKCALSLAFDARPWLAEISCPSLVLTGTLDPVVPTRAGHELARRIPDARLHCLPGGHLAHITRPDEASVLIARWMADQCGGVPLATMATRVIGDACSARPVSETRPGLAIHRATRVLTSPSARSAECVG
jgi:pimeloyl-ACP methyl ester carboxylesterase